LVKIKTIFFINGSSIGGGEIDGIIRANISNGIVVCLNTPCREIINLFQKLKINTFSLKEYISHLFFSKNFEIELHSNGFLRDLKYIFIILLSYIIKLKNFRLILEVHSDPKSGLKKISHPLKFIIFIYEIYGLIFADKIRFVSHRQLSTFKYLSKKSYYIDPPISFLTRKALFLKKNIDIKKYDIIFVSRLTKSILLGDTKNKDFLFSLIKTLDNKKCKILLISELGQNDTEFSSNVEIKKPTVDIIYYLNQSKILIHPSIHEGYSLIVREASLLGCKVVASSAIAPEIQNLKNVSIINNFKIENWLNNIEKLLKK